MEEGKKNRLFALTVTIVVHVAILLLLLFYTLSAPVIRENDGGGVVLQLGVIDADAGTFTPTAMVSHPQPVEPEPVITQDMEETVSLDDEKPEPVVVPEESDKKVEPQPEPETSQVDDLWADALNKGKVADSIAAKGEKKGSPQGSAESGALAGSPGYGDYDLGGRGLIGRLPKPEYAGTNDEGTIVVEVLVDPQGRVVQANVTPSGSKGTAASNVTLRSRAEAAARRLCLNISLRVMRISGVLLLITLNRTDIWGETGSRFFVGNENLVGKSCLALEK